MSASATHANPACYHVSASSIAAYKACPTRFRLGYREGLRTAEDTESQRVGTNWHNMHETYANALDAYKEGVGGDAPQPVDEEKKSFALTAVVQLLNDRYGKCPASKTVEEWKLERQILLTCFLGYLWYYQNDPIEFLVSELPFELPIHMPRSGLPLPRSEVVRVGKIDHVIRWQGAVGALERKSTSRSIAADSDYWDKAKKDTQVSMYALAFREIERTWNVEPTDTRVGNTLYDVWHRPTIKPKTLTQAATAEFISTGKYMGAEFIVQQGGDFAAPTVTVDGELAEIEPGKKGFAIRETVDMFGARLMQDIYERPDFYFVRREIARTDLDLKHFRQQLFSIYQSQKLSSKYNVWVENESACRATYSCPYIPICYGPGADAVCDGKTTPAGFKRIFVDLTVNGQEIEE
jgi:hypothetical protein